MDDRSEAVREWLAKADDDLATARIVLATTSPPTCPAAFHCQQIVEKCLKALLIQENIVFGRTHRLVDLGKLLAQRFPEIERYFDLFEAMTVYAADYRYPGTYTPPTVEEAGQLLADAERVREFCFERIGN